MRFRILVSICAMVLFGGCSYFSGVSVTFDPNASDAVVKDLGDYLEGRGFDLHAKDGGRVYYRHGATGLRAQFRTRKEGLSFGAGKVNSKAFTDDEIELIDGIVLWMVSHHELILRGQVSKRCVSADVRKQFKERIQDS